MNDDRLPPHDLDTCLHGEIWRTVSGWPYEVSSLGRIRRSGSAMGARIGRILKTNVNCGGYPQVQLRNNNKPIGKLVHRLVAEAFIGPCPEGKECNHKDGNKANSSPANLEYVTRSDNLFHSYAIGLHTPLRGERNPFAKLTDAQVLAIRAMGAAGLSQSHIAKRFGINRSHVSRILRRECWAHAE